MVSLSREDGPAIASIVILRHEAVRSAQRQDIGLSRVVPPVIRMVFGLHWLEAEAMLGCVDVSEA